MFNVYSRTDFQIQNDLISALANNPYVTSSQVVVAVNDGIATLSGSVPSHFEKSLVNQLAQAVDGVRAVVEEIEINLMGSYTRSDAQIAESALLALQTDDSVPKDIHVTIENGWLTLNGKVQSDDQRTAAENSVRHLMGVSGIHNQIVLS
jgi:osmotically-inducible protein OsmY